MAIDKESSGVPEVDLSRRTTKVNLAMIVGVGLFFMLGIGAILFFARRAGPDGHADSDSLAMPYLIGIPVVLVIPALYWLFTRKAKGGSGGDRSDVTERPELRGAEQARHREKL